MFLDKISRRDLDQFSNQIAGAKFLRALDPVTLTIEQKRLIDDADRSIDNLLHIDLDQLKDDALGRYGEILAAAKGLTLKRVGPVADAFRNDRSAISTIMGPYGSAKTTTAFQKIINSVIWQPPCPDGVRRARWAVFRDTYGHLETNVMADWFMWFPKNDNFNQRTLTHKLRLDIPLAGGEVMKLYLEMLFRAVGDQSAEELAKGLSLTGAWLNEKDTLHIDVFKYVFPRCGRYRPPGLKQTGWSGLIGDMNAPDVDNWAYDFNVNKNIGVDAETMRGLQRQFGDNFKVSFHVQPSGLSPNAENLDNLPPGYYERLQLTMSEQEQQRFIGNKFGAVSSGSPVYTGYRDQRHCLENLNADPRLSVWIMLDGGNTPAALFMQKAENGQIRVVDECVVFSSDAKTVLQKLGAYEFGVTCGEYWNEHFARMKLAGGFGDPSAWYGGSDKHEEDADWIARFTKGFNATAIGVKLKLKPAPVKANRIGPRLESVRELLKDDIDGEPKYVISARCKYLRQGFNSGYVSVRVQYTTGGGRWKDEPLKNDFSHVHDANQYGCLGLTKFSGWEDVQDAGRRSERAKSRTKGKVAYGNSYFSPKKRKS